MRSEDLEVPYGQDISTADVKYYWYFLVIENLQSPDYNNPYYFNMVFLNEINGAFSNNEWIYQSFLKLYADVLSSYENVQYHTVKVGPCSYRELCNSDFRKIYNIDIPFDGDRTICKLSIELLNKDLYVTESLWNMMFEDYSSYDYLSEEIIPGFIYDKLMLDRFSNYINRDNPNIGLLYKNIERLFIYCIFYIILTDMDCSTFELDKWFDYIPKALKTILKEAKFEFPWEYYTSNYEIVNEDYMLMNYTYNLINLNE